MRGSRPRRPPPPDGRARQRAGASVLPSGIPLREVDPGRARRDEVERLAARVRQRCQARRRGSRRRHRRCASVAERPAVRERVAGRGRDRASVGERQADHAVIGRRGGGPKGDDGAGDPIPGAVERPERVADAQGIDRDRALGRVDQGAPCEADRAHRLAGCRLLVDRDLAGAVDRAAGPQARRRTVCRLGKVVEAIRAIADRVERDRQRDLPDLVDRELLGVGQRAAEGDPELRCGVLVDVALGLHLGEAFERAALLVTVRHRVHIGIAIPMRPERVHEQEPQLALG